MYLATGQWVEPEDALARVLDPARLRKALESVLALHRVARTGYRGLADVCEHCTDLANGVEVSFPCATVIDLVDVLTLDL